MESVPALPGDPGLRTMVILACIGILFLVVGSTVGALKKDASLTRAAGIPLVLLGVTLSLGQRAQGYHVYIMASIAALIVWNAYQQHGAGRWICGIAAGGIAGAVCCALLLF